MMKKLLLIIGMMLSLAYPGAEAYAQNCDPLSGDLFECEENQMHNYCGIFHGAGKGSRSLYRSAYCQIGEDTTSESIDVVAEQLELDKDVIRDILNGHVNKEDIPAEFIDRYTGSESFNPRTQQEIYQIVKRTLDNERALYQIKEGMKPRLESKEIWADGSLANSPFDLIVDLNLIDIVLFGSSAEWEDNVYQHKNKKDNDDSGDDDATGDDDAGGAASSNLGGAADLPSLATYNPDDINPSDIECVGADDPNAVLPGPGQAPLTCGDGVLDNGESCDDGNPLAGDGCSPECLIEPGGHGGNANKSGAALCVDPNALTLRPYMADADGDGNGDDNKENIFGACPAGLYPSQDFFVKATAPAPLNIPGEITQPENYPGPNIGGVFKNFPNANKPNCPAGMTELLPTKVVGQELDDEDKIPRCIPTQLCADFNAAREVIRKTGADEQTVAAIEAMVCIEVETGNRPPNPYKLNEGCVDCHVAAMQETLDRMLQKNLTPLENTKQAFGLSNRWGPTFSFDLITSIKPYLKLKEPSKPANEQTNEALDDIYDVLSETTVPTVQKQDLDQQQKVITYQKYIADKRNEFKAQLESYQQSSSESSGDAEFHNRIDGLLKQVLSSFTRMDKNFKAIQAAPFSEKDQCKCN